MKKILAGLTIAMFASSAFAEGERVVRPKTKCHGNEPFWGLEIKGGAISFEHPGEAALRYRIVNQSPFAGHMAEFAEAFVGRTQAGGELTVSILHKTCTDSMSDYNWEYTAVVRQGSNFFYGCCGTGEVAE